MWVSESRLARAGAEWTACGAQRGTLEAAKRDARSVHSAQMGSEAAFQLEFRVGTAMQGCVYQVGTHEKGRLRWMVDPALPCGCAWQGEYRAPGVDWERVTGLGTLEKAIQVCEAWHRSSVHNGGTFRIVQNDARGSIWAESNGPHAEKLVWVAPGR